MDCYTLFFKDSFGKLREVAQIQSIKPNGSRKSENEIFQEANLQIRAFCAERNFRIYYTRCWEQEDRTIFDVGSHTEFFHLVPRVDIKFFTGEAEDDEAR